MYCLEYTSAGCRAPGPQSVTCSLFNHKQNSLGLRIFTWFKNEGTGPQLCVVAKKLDADLEFAVMSKTNEKQPNHPSSKTTSVGGVEPTTAEIMWTFVACFGEDDPDVI